MRISSLRLWLPALACALLAACGSGDNSTFTASQSVVTTGAISGFGSVYLNGIHFETTGTSFWRDGSAATQGDLRVGHMIEVTGHVDGSGRAVADTIHQHDSLGGSGAAHGNVLAEARRDRYLEVRAGIFRMTARRQS